MAAAVISRPGSRRRAQAISRDYFEIGTREGAETRSTMPKSSKIPDPTPVNQLKVGREIARNFTVFKRPRDVGLASAVGHCHDRALARIESRSLRAVLCCGGARRLMAPTSQHGTVSSGSARNSMLARAAARVRFLGARAGGGDSPSTPCRLVCGGGKLQGFGHCGWSCYNRGRVLRRPTAVAIAGHRPRALRTSRLNFLCRSPLGSASGAPLQSVPLQSTPRHCIVAVWL